MVYKCVYCWRTDDKSLRRVGTIRSHSFGVPLLCPPQACPVCIITSFITEIIEQNTDTNSNNNTLFAKLTQDAFGSLPVPVDRTISLDRRPKTAHDRTECRVLDSASDWHGPNDRARAFCLAAVWPSNAPYIATANNCL